MLDRQLARKKSLSAALYSDWKTGVLTYDEYCFAKEQYAQEVAALERQRLERKSVYEDAAEQTDRACQWAEKIRAHQDAEQMTKELVDAFITCVRVDRNNEVSICFSFEKDREMLERAIKRLRKEAA